MNKSTRSPTCHRGPCASKTKSTSTVEALPFFKTSKINRKTPHNLLMQNVSVQLYTISTTQKGQRLLICFESDLSALLHYKVDAACKLAWVFSFLQTVWLSKALRSLWPFHLYLYSVAGTCKAGAHRGSRHAELIRLESCPLRSPSSLHSAPAGGPGKAVIKIDKQKHRVAYFRERDVGAKKKKTDQKEQCPLFPV